MAEVKTVESVLEKIRLLEETEIKQRKNHVEWEYNLVKEQLTAIGLINDMSFKLQNVSLEASLIDDLIHALFQDKQVEFKVLLVEHRDLTNETITVNWGKWPGYFSIAVRLESYINVDDQNNVFKYMVSVIRKES